MMRRNLRGASLVEVLVVIVVLLIGIMAFIRLYPSGFFIIQQSGQSGSATRLAELELERLKGRNDSLPFAIVPIRYNNMTNLLEINPDLPPDELGVDRYIPPGVDPSYLTGVNRFRMVLQERVNIPLPSDILATGYADRGSVYMTTFAPIMQRADVGEALHVYGNVMDRRIMDCTQPPPRRGLDNYQYGIDYDEGCVLFRPQLFRDTQYRVEFSYWQDQGDGTYRAVQVIRTVPVQAGPPFPTWFDLKNIPNPNSLPGFAGIVPDSDIVAREFTQLNPTDAWSNNYPYEYKFINAQLGLIAFNPAAATYYERYGRGQRPLAANLDYVVHNWEIIREERALPDNGVIKLSLSDLKQTGDLQNNQTEYRGLGLVDDPDSPYGLVGTEDILLVSPVTGRYIKISKGQVFLVNTLSPNLDIIPLSNVTVDYGAGVIRFTDVANFLNVHRDFRTFRVLYKVQNEWAMSVQKAPESFEIYSDPSLATKPDTCYVGDSTPGVGSPRRLYFRLSEAGKTVVLREYYYRDGNQNVHRGTNGVFKISDRTQTDSIMGVSMVYVDLTERHSDAASWDWREAGIAVRGVMGASVKVRLTWQPPGWQTAGPADQAGNPTPRFKVVDFDTLLTREE